MGRRFQRADWAHEPPLLNGGALMAETRSPLDWSIYFGTEADKPDSTDSPGTYYIGSVCSAASRQVGWVTVNWESCAADATPAGAPSEKVNLIKSRRDTSVQYTRRCMDVHTHVSSHWKVECVQTQVFTQPDNHLDGMSFILLVHMYIYFYMKFICDSVHEINSLYCCNHEQIKLICNTYTHLLQMWILDSNVERKKIKKSFSPKSYTQNDETLLPSDRFLLILSSSGGARGVISPSSSIKLPPSQPPSTPGTRRASPFIPPHSIFLFSALHSENSDRLQRGLPQRRT